MKLTDLTGRVFGELTVIGIGPTKRIRCGRAVRHWMCKCKCGNVKEIMGENLLSGMSKACGCKRIPAVQAKKTTHGETRNGSPSKEYLTWSRMKGRCYSKTNKKYPQYGGRGITVCDQWLESFENFLRDMGRCPKGCNSIDRKNVDEGYDPENCVWADDLRQANNKQNTVWTEMDGVKMSVLDAARLRGLPHRKVFHQFRTRGKSIEEACRIVSEKITSRI